MAIGDLKGAGQKIYQRLVLLNWLPSHICLNARSDCFQVLLTEGQSHPFSACAQCMNELQLRGKTIESHR